MTGQFVLMRKYPERELATNYPICVEVLIQKNLIVEQTTEVS